MRVLGGSVLALEAIVVILAIPVVIVVGGIFALLWLLAIRLASEVEGRAQ